MADFFAPIACSLEAGDFHQRLAWIAQINCRYLREQRREGPILQLSYDAEAAELVEEMVRREQVCCAFLSFNLTKGTDRLDLTIRVPDEAADNAAILLAPFLGDQTVRSDVYCAKGDCNQDSMESPISNTPIRVPAVSVLSTVVATGAVACGVCCILPFVFPAVALTTTGSVLAWLGRAHLWVTAGASLLVVGGWAWIWNMWRRARARVSASTLTMMSLATAGVLVAVAWPRLEPSVMALLTR